MLLQQDVLIPASAAPNLLQPADRRLMQHVLLLAARDGAPAISSAVTSVDTAAAPGAGLAVVR
jgi:hypothetical protein